jgi:hypothetical protein
MRPMLCARPIRIMYRCVSPALVYWVSRFPACAARSGSFLSAERGSSPAAGLRELVSFSAVVFAQDRANISREISEWILALLSMLMCKMERDSASRERVSPGDRPEHCVRRARAPCRSRCWRPANGP